MSAASSSREDEESYEMGWVQEAVHEHAGDNLCPACATGFLTYYCWGCSVCKGMFQFEHGRKHRHTKPRWHGRCRRLPQVSCGPPMRQAESLASCSHGQASRHTARAHARQRLLLPLLLCHHRLRGVG